MNLWIDDCKPAPDETWAVAKDFVSAYHMLRQFHYDEVAVDHDLADTGPTGYHLLVAMENGEVHLPKSLRIISLNPVGIQRMKQVAARLGIPVSVWAEALPIVGDPPSSGGVRA